MPWGDGAGSLFRYYCLFWQQPGARSPGHGRHELPVSRQAGCGRGCRVRGSWWPGSPQSCVSPGHSAGFGCGAAGSIPRAFCKGRWLGGRRHKCQHGSVEGRAGGGKAGGGFRAGMSSRCICCWNPLLPPTHPAALTFSRSQTCQHDPLADLGTVSR